MVSGELEKSLRGAVDEYINSRLSGLQEEITRLQAQVNEAFTQLAERTRGDGETDMSVSASISEHIHAAHERGIEAAVAESASTRASSDIAILKAGIDELSEQHSQAEILNTLVNRAASFAPRVAFFVVKNDQAIGWRARGLEGTVGDDAVREIVLPLSADTPLSDVVRSRNTWSGSPGSNAEDYLLLNRLGSDPPQRMVALPLVARGRAAAVLYADSAALDADAINLEALETLVRVAGMAVELLVGGGGARTATAPTPQQAQTAPARPQDAPPPAETPEPPRAAAPPQAVESWGTGEGEATPTAVVQAPPAADAGPQPSSDAPATAEEYTGEETLVMEAPSASATDSVAAEDETTAGYDLSQPAPTPPPAPEQASASVAGGAARGWRSADAAELPVEVGSDEERRLHNDARRFARLLVSEIKLYNEQKVREGRLEGDLYERLREDIDRSRQMYDKRVFPAVATRYDYFHQELVNTLAEGDPSKLGGDYPGATA